MNNRVFQELLTDITLAENIADLDKICARIDRHFQAENIRWDQNEVLYNLIAKVSNGYYHRAGIKQIRKEEA